MIGLTRAQAETKTKAAGLGLRVEGSTRRGDEKVCEQDPDPGYESFSVTAKFGLACQKVRRAAAARARARKTERKRIADQAAARAIDVAKAATARKKAADRAAAQATSGRPPEETAAPQVADDESSTNEASDDADLVRQYCSENYSGFFKTDQYNQCIEANR